MTFPVYRYGLDPTGINPDNFVANEPHTLADRRIRSAVPKEGSFYGDSVAVIDMATGLPLNKGTQYVCQEYLRTPSEMYGKPVYGIILIIDPKVSASISWSYQAVGCFYSATTDTIKSLLEQHRDDGTEFNYYDVVGKPDAFDPVPHLHSLSDGMKFEYMVYMLERIRNAILWKDSAAYQDIYNYINAFLNDLDARMKHKMDNFMLPILLDFKAQITKALLGLDKVENLRVATKEEGEEAALRETRAADFLERKYIALDTIVAFKDILYSHMVSKSDTGIGLQRATYVPATREKLFLMTNGSIVSFLSRRESSTASTTFDDDVYPKEVDNDTRVAVVKVVGNRNNNGGIYLAYEYGGDGAYYGIHASGNVADEMSWKKFLFSTDLQVYVDDLARHIADTNNPHKTRKDQVGLSEVENLPVITREEILCLKSVRKYMTFDAFLLFMKSFMIGKNGSAADPGDESNEPLENCQIIYCPCSPCGCGTSTTPTPPTTPPAGQLIETFCRGFDNYGRYTNGAGSTYESLIMTNSPDCGYTAPPAPPASGTLLSEFCKGTSKWGKYADGAGGSTERLVQEKSASCGFVALQPKITFSTDRPQISVGTVETMTVRLSGYEANKNVKIHWWLKGPGTGNQAQDVRQDDVFISSDGTGVYNLVGTDDGTTVPRGSYDNWIITPSTGTESNHITRTFVGNTVTPTLTLSSTHQVIQQGTNETLSLQFSGFTPNSSVIMQGYIRGPSFNNNNPFQVLNIPIQINSSGSYRWTQTGVDDGTTVPRGSYDNWMVVTSLGVESNHITRTFVGPSNPAPGTKINEKCVGVDLVGVFANGSGGTYEQVLARNHGPCGYTAPPALVFQAWLCDYGSNNDTPQKYPSGTLLDISSGTNLARGMTTGSQGGLSVSIDVQYLEAGTTQVVASYRMGTSNTASNGNNWIDSNLTAARGMRFGRFNVRIRAVRNGDGAEAFSEAYPVIYNAPPIEQTG